MSSKKKSGESGSWLQRLKKSCSGEKNKEPDYELDPPESSFPVDPLNITIVKEFPTEPPATQYMSRDEGDGSYTGGCGSSSREESAAFKEHNYDDDEEQKAADAKKYKKKKKKKKDGIFTIKVFEGTRNQW